MKYGLAITTYNNFDYLIKASKELVRYNNFFEKILIVDDNSSESVDKINFLKLKSEQIVFYSFPKNFGGPAKSRNYAIKYFKSLNFNFITFLDPDDYLDIDKFRELKEILMKHKYIDALSVLHFSDKHQQHHSNQIKKNTLKSINRTSLKFHNPLGFSGLTINLNRIITQFSEDKKNIAVEDYDFYLKLLEKKQNFYLYKKKIVNYGFYNFRSDHLSSNKFKMLIKFSRINIKHFGVINLPINLTYWIIINIKKRIINLI